MILQRALWVEVENVGAGGGVLASQPARCAPCEGEAAAARVRTTGHRCEPFRTREKQKPSGGRNVLLPKIVGRYTPFAISILLVIYFNRFAHAIQLYYKRLA